MFGLIRRTIGGEVASALAALAATYVVIGASFGALAASLGLAWWIPSIMSLLVFAGASQFLFLAVVASGANPLAAAIAGGVVNLRLAPLSMAARSAMGHGTLRRTAGAHLVTDESVAFVMAAPFERRRSTFWISGVSLFLAWNLGTVLGVAAGPVLGDGSTLGLDAAFPALLFAVLLGALTTMRHIGSAVGGALVGVVATPFVAPGAAVLLAGFGATAAWGIGSRRRP